MKKLCKIFIFLFIFCILWNCIFKILWLEKTPIKYFYDEPKNSLDVVYVGSSNAYAHFNTTLAYHLYGFTTGMLSADSQPFAVVKYLIKESEKYQKPNLYVIDIAKLVDDLDSFGEGDIRKSTDSMKFSKNRNDAIDELLHYSKGKKDDCVNYYFSFLTYHNRWKNLSSQNFIGDNHLYKGYLLFDATVQQEPQQNYKWSVNTIKLQKENKKVLMNLIDYIQLEKLNTLFVIPIRTFQNKDDERLNDAISILKKEKMNVINFNDLKDFTVDFNKDFYNFAHLNVYGSTKYTIYFSNYLKENYSLKDRRNSKIYRSWDREYERFKTTFKELTNIKFEQYLSQIKS